MWMVEGAYTSREGFEFPMGDFLGEGLGFSGVPAWVEDDDAGLVEAYEALTNTFYLYKKHGFVREGWQPQGALERVAAEQDFQLYAGRGAEPQVVVLGYSHPDGMAQAHEIAEILRAELRPGDVILCEGCDPSEAIYSSYPRGAEGDVISLMLDHLTEMGVRTLYNDHKGSIGRLMIASARVKRYEQEAGPALPEHADYRTAQRLFKRAMNERDAAMCHNKHTGFFRLLDRTAEFYKLPSPNARYFQLTGSLHVLNGLIERELEMSGVEHAIFIPRRCGLGGE
jgi:hypothetical protein